MITWAYVAGFMDGEGTVRTNYIRLYQKNPEVLYQISAFLNNNGIPAYVHQRKTPRTTNFLVVEQESTLQVNTREAITNLLVKVLPYLIVKRTEAQDVLRQFKMFPRRTNREIGMLGRERSSSKYGRGLHDKIKRDAETGQFSVAV